MTPRRYTTTITFREGLNRKSIVYNDNGWEERPTRTFFVVKNGVLWIEEYTNPVYGTTKPPREIQWWHTDSLVNVTAYNFSDVEEYTQEWSNSGSVVISPRKR
jgi:hypothetical protein